MPPPAEPISPSDTKPNAPQLAWHLTSHTLLRRAALLYLSLSSNEDRKCLRPFSRQIQTSSHYAPRAERAARYSKRNRTSRYLRVCSSSEVAHPSDIPGVVSFWHRSRDRVRKELIPYSGVEVLLFISRRCCLEAMPHACNGVYIHPDSPTTQSPFVSMISW